MYDHPYDHVPAMVFSEAARQCAHLLAADGAGAGAGHGRVLQLDGLFSKFAELDDLIELTCRADEEAGPDRYRMTALQDGATVAEITLRLG
jgi:hypothetical protein